MSRPLVYLVLNPTQTPLWILPVTPGQRSFQKHLKSRTRRRRPVTVSGLSDYRDVKCPPFYIQPQGRVEGAISTVAVVPGRVPS